MPYDATEANPHTARFWLYELNEPQNISGPVGVSASYPSSQSGQSIATHWLLQAPSINQKPHFTQQNQPKYKPYVTQFSSMPWFQREFCQAEQNHTSDLSMAIGSCLHPGSTFERDRSDSIFEGVWKHAVEAIPLSSTNEQSNNTTMRELDLMLLLGDQIYADATAELFDSKDYYERYRKRYRSAWTGTWMRRVMSHLPTHYVIDDHEFHDNFDGDPHEAELYNIEQAKREAHNFQIHTSNTTTYEQDVNKLQFWHSFDRLEVPFFCFDTRFERSGKKDGSLKSLFGEDLTQWNEFVSWLGRQQNTPVLFLASGSPLCPVSKKIVSHPQTALESDALLAYPEFLENLLEQLHRNCQKTHIVWLAGDPHFSSIANVKLSSRGKQAQLTSITASGLYAAIPFANASTHEYEWDTPQTLNLDNVQIDFEQQLLSDAHQQFTRLDLSISSKLLTVASHGPDGMPLGNAKTLNLKNKI